MIVGALILGTILLWTPWRRAGRWLTSLAVGVLAAIAILPIDGFLIRTLENRFPTPQTLPGTVDGILVLGGASQAGIFLDRGHIAFGDKGERLIEFAALARQYPEAVLIFTGGGKSKRPEIPTEADVAAEVLAMAGLDVSRVLFEDRATDTYQNALYAAELAHPEPGQIWLLVTSAAHIPRAVGSFRAAGWDVLPYPVDYTTASKGRVWWTLPLPRGGCGGRSTLRVT